MEKNTLIDPVQIITLNVAPVEEKPTQILIQRDTTNLIKENEVEKLPVDIQTITVSVLRIVNNLQKSLTPMHSILRM